MEIWKVYKDFDFIQVSNLGRVKVTRFDKERILKPDLVHGYLRIRFYIDNKQYRKLVHRLVAETFIPNPNNKPFVNHIDGNTVNAKVDNLEWVDQKENIHHSRYITKHGKVISIKKIRELLKTNSHLSTEEFAQLLIDNAN